MTRDEANAVDNFYRCLAVLISVYKKEYGVRLMSSLEFAISQLPRIKRILQLKPNEVYWCGYYLKEYYYSLDDYIKIELDKMAENDYNRWRELIKQHP